MIKKIKKSIQINFLIVTAILFVLSCSDTSPNESAKIISNSNNEIVSSMDMLGYQKDSSNIFWIKGSGSIKQKQEIVEVNIAIENRDKEIKNATNVVNENINKILEIAKEIGIKNDQITTAEYSITPVTRWVEKKDEYGDYGESQIIAYKVYNSFVITSDDKEKITDFIDQSNLVTGNSFRVNNIRFKANISENNKVLAREKAIENALDKAKFYSEKLDINLGKIISFEEYLPGNPINKSMNDMPMMRMAEAMPSTELFAGESEIISEVYLGFEIK
ncbi:MAG: SIMPL domain-containing protein [Dehalococcoidia bacterium]|nr:hypothetical protein [Chloroflexota bacterium]OUW96428.1 MAG: hypothetical protein CBD90_00690 [Chloroflexi bacterium TMED230]RZP13328.1 MAG: DUF541 domain-containing protein [Chloroflexota bacterium]|tara:strand:- start:6399 stop:7226 length:828 start_codon:yes stop_codon:yes gene_type:complete